MIGLLGASGAVGSAAAELLPLPLRLGSRRRPAQVRPGAEVVETDITDEARLAEFCRGCTVVLNCAGPSAILGDRVARAALVAGASYVDAFGDDVVHEALRSAVLPVDFIAVLSAGTVPGLSGVLPIWLTRRGIASLDRVSAHAGGLERCTPAAAADMLLSVTGTDGAGGSYGQALAAWQDGAVRPGALRVTEDTRLPFFPDPVTVQPYLSTEAQRLARTLGAARVEWHTVFPGPRARMSLARWRAEPPTTPSTVDRAVTDLVTAAEVDLAGRSPYYVITVRAEGRTADGTPHRATAVLRTEDSYRLTATVAVAAVEQVLAGAIPPGVHFAAQALEPEVLVERVRSAGAVTVLEAIIDGGAEDEEGVL
ncbi:saccharopine dehydrogenase NADP-binding domain-containing protein [Crossiella sp. NPDC003009]